MGERRTVDVLRERFSGALIRADRGYDGD